MEEIRRSHYSEKDSEKLKVPSADIEIRRLSHTPLELLSKIHKQDDSHPITWPLWKKWIIVSIYCLLEVFVTLTSTAYVSVEFLIQKQWPCSHQVVTLGQSMFIIGTAVGPAFLGPLSDFAGRRWVYVGSIFLYAIFNIGTALAYNLPMLIIFCFLIGLVGSTAVCNVAGTISDLFGDDAGAAQPMALFVWGANVGPSLGSPIGEWIAENPDMGWRWVFYLNIIFGGVFAFSLIFVPETLPRIVISNNVKRRGSIDSNALDIATGTAEINVLQEIRFVASMAMRILFTEPIVVFLGLYNGFSYGLLFLYLDGVFEVFVVNNGRSYLSASLTYLNFCVGVTFMFILVPVQTWLFTRDKKKNGGAQRPEARFLTSLVFVWGFPISLFWFAFTSNGNFSYWSPIVAGSLLGFCDPLLWLSMLNYITDSYPNVAASAVAAFLIPSFLIAASFAHAGVSMFENLSTTWAFATLAFCSLPLVGLVYILYFFGPIIRRHSKLASNI